MLNSTQTKPTRFQANNVEALASQLVTRWATSTAGQVPRDPFSTDICVVPSLAMARWLSQFFADHLSICAGIEFPTLSQFERDYLGDEATAWQPRKLVWLLREVLTGDTSSELSRLRAHLSSQPKPHSTLTQIAHLFARYAHYRPQMVAQWRVGADVDVLGKPLEDASWQAHLWRLLRHHLGGKDAVELYDEALKVPSDSSSESGGIRIAFFCLREISPLQQKMVSSLSMQAQVDIFELKNAAHRALFCKSLASINNSFEFGGTEQQDSTGQMALAFPTENTPSENEMQTASTSSKAQSLLCHLQDSLIDAQRPILQLHKDDDSVQFHLSHGLDRQVEVLRDVLARLFLADPTLEPRDIAVLTPDVFLAATLVNAAFAPIAGKTQHPASAFRVQVTGSQVHSTNSFAEVLIRVLKLSDTRFTVSDFLDFVAIHPVTNKFHFDDFSRLEKLIHRAEIKWGLDESHMSHFGLDGFPQNTWVHGLQRLLLGVAVSTDELAFVKNVLPVDDVDSSDVRVLGLLSELIGRLNRLVRECEQPCSMAEWMQRFSRILTELTLPMPTEQDDFHWVSDHLSKLADAAGNTSQLDRLEVLGVIESHLSASTTRARFSNGSLLVGSIDDLRAIPHRVICLLGWDASRYPRSTRIDGNDLMQFTPLPGDPDRNQSDQLALIDALCSAREKLVIICQGRSENTNLEVPLAAPLATLREHLSKIATLPTGQSGSIWGKISHQYPLQYFSPHNYFHEAWKSFDQDGYRGAKSLISQQTNLSAASELHNSQGVNASSNATSPFSEMAIEDAHEELSPSICTTATGITEQTQAQGAPTSKTDHIAVTLENLAKFFRDPASYLMQNRAGISLSTPRVDDDIPLVLDGLARYALGNAALNWRKAGHSYEKIANALWRSGILPPRSLGRAELKQAQTAVTAIEAAVQSRWNIGLSEFVSGLRPVQVDAQGHNWHITGQVLCQANYVPLIGYSKLKSSSVLTSWIQLLALVATGTEVSKAAIIAKAPLQNSVRASVKLLQAPNATQAQSILNCLIEIYKTGCRQVLPAVPDINSYFAEQARLGLICEKRRIENRWKYHDPAWDFFYPTLDALLDVPALAELPASSAKTLQEQLALTIWLPILEAEVDDC